MKRQYRTGIIGLGNIGFRYSLDAERKWISSHLEAYSKHPDFLPVAGCDIDSRRLKDAKEYSPSLNLYASWKEMLKTENLDILSVCVSPAMNLEVSFFPSISRLKMLIFEKPLSTNIKNGMRIIKNLKGFNVLATVNHFRRWQDTFLKVKSLIACGIIGRIIKINGRYATDLFNGGIHLIDTIQYLVGNFREIQALDKNKIKNSEDFTYSAYGLINGAEVFIAGFDKVNYNIFEIEIWGDIGRIVVDGFGTRLSLWKRLESKRFAGQYELKGYKRFRTLGLGSNFINLLDNVKYAIENKQEDKLNCRLTEAVKTVSVANAIMVSYNRKGKKIALDE